MGYNHAREVKKFYKEWRRLLRVYRDLGMTYQQILVLYKYDKAMQPCGRPKAGRNRKGDLYAG